MVNREVTFEKRVHDTTGVKYLLRVQALEPLAKISRNCEAKRRLTTSEA
jgi:hypothetical protein